MNQPAPLTQQPPRRTRIRRDFVKLLLLLLGCTLFAIVIVRYLSHSHLTAAERREQEELRAAAKEPAARPETLAKRLEDQRNLAQARLHAAQAPAGGTPFDDTGIPKGKPGDGPLPPGFKVPNGNGEHLSAQDRLALQRQAEQLDNQSLVAYEDTSSRQSNPAGGVNSLSNVVAGLTAAAEANSANAAASEGADLPNRTQNVSRLAAGANNTSSAPLAPVPSPSPYLVKEGTPINTVMLGGTNSDLPGTFRALVDHDIVDGTTGQCVLIPKATMVVGITHSDIAIGQERLLVAGTRMIWPNGASMSLTKMTGADPNGNAGLTSDVNNHFFKIFGSTLLIAGVAAWVGHNQSQPTGTTINVNGGSSNDMSAAAADSLSQTTRAMLQRNMNIQPTLTTRPGQRMVIVTTRDMVIPPNIVHRYCDATPAGS
ncbi:MAG: TrbI/VirB10 family protein [Paraburkholderia sp.]|nr:MAG: TrbI/VirB10 family protein [Paraburkholderia sp.]